jgi:hypothetical protein
MTERNEEALSTRDLASPKGSAAGAVTAPDSEARDVETSREPPVEAYDRAETSRGDGTVDTQADDRRLDTQGGEPEGESGSVQTPRSSGDVAAKPETDSTPAPASSAPQDENAAAPASSDGVRAAASEASEPLLPAELTAAFQRRWEEVQTRFVDEPRGAVEDADSLVANLMQQLADGFAQERERLEAQWGRGEDISTEDLRVALQRYRSFFHRLLST